MSYPLEDAGFTNWYGDLEVHLKRLHGLNIKDLGLDHRSLAARYYAGETVFRCIETLGLPQPG